MKVHCTQNVSEISQMVKSHNADTGKVNDREREKKSKTNNKNLHTKPETNKTNITPLQSQLWLSVGGLKKRIQMLASLSEVLIQFV